MLALTMADILKSQRPSMPTAETRYRGNFRECVPAAYSLQSVPWYGTLCKGTIEGTFENFRLWNWAA